MADTKYRLLSPVTLEQLKRTGRKVLGMLAGVGVRLSMIGLAALVVLLLLYQTVVVPMQKEIGLPSGISPTKPEINQTRLEAVVDEQLRRVPKGITRFPQALLLFPVIPSISVE